MPHSSGGGSHGGGSHGGGGRHSSGGGSRSGVTLPRVSSSKFKGSKRYVKYRHGRPKYFYSDMDPAKREVRLWILIFYLPFLIMLFISIKNAFGFAKPLSTNYDHKVIVEDNCGVIDNERALRESFSRFYQRTGITPSIITVHDEDWKNHYSSLENYAYEKYVKTFNDESHWLFLYSEPEHPDKEFNDWSWEGMQGNDTDPVLTQRITSAFNEEFQKNLLKDNEHSVGQALKISFDYITPKTLKMDLNTPALVVFLLVLAFVFFYGMGMAGLTPSYFRTRGAVLAPEEYATDSTSSNGVSPAALINLNKQKEKCVFCDSIFPAGTYTTCPNCGGSLVSIESSPKGNGNPAASSNPYTGASVGPGRQPTFWEK